jgi:twitching motility protein PilT
MMTGRPATPPTDAPRPDSDDARRGLATLDFTDLYVSAGGDAFVRVAPTAPLMVVPADLRTTVTLLSRALGSRVAARPERREFSVSYEGITYRVALLDAIDGLWYVLRRGPTRVPPLEGLGLHPRLLAELIELGRSQRHGLVVIAGKTGDGKTTTASALLNTWLEYYGEVAVTIEDPPEFPLHGTKRNCEGYCFQRDVQEKEFGDALVAAMRYTPRYILLGEIRSETAAREALRASVNGHIVVTTLHAGSVEEALHRLLDLAAAGEGRRGAQAVLADGLSMVLHQRLFGEGGERRMECRFVIPGPGIGDPARAIVRNGRIEQLGTEIEAQMARLLETNGGRKSW